MKFVNVGKVHSAQGLKGELFIWIFSGEAYWSDHWQILYLAEDKGTVPTREIKILKALPHEKQKKWGFRVKLEGVTSRNLAEEIEKMSVLVPEAFLVSDDDEDIYLREVLGFRVIDETRGDVGEVTGFAGNAFQDLLIINNEKGSYEVPFVEPLLIEIDKNNQTILMDIPQGLVLGEEL